MSTTATYDDANLILRLYEVRREEKLRAAREWFSTVTFRSLAEFLEQCPPGSEASAKFRMVTSYWEMVASFMTSGVLSQELFFHNGMELLGCWEKIKHLVPDFRDMAKNPLLAQNLEQVAGRYAQWLEKKAPGSYAAMSTMIQAQKDAARS